MPVEYLLQDDDASNRGRYEIKKMRMGDGSNEHDGYEGNPINFSF